MPKLQDILCNPALNGIYRLTAPAELVPVLDGRGLADKQRLLVAVGRALDFPDYYGANWDALEECLGDLSWRAGPAWLLVRQAGAIPEEWRLTLLDVFADAAEHWAAEGRVFSLFLEGLEDESLPEAD
jgi:hypothetical protein